MILQKPQKNARGQESVCRVDKIACQSGCSTDSTDSTDSTYSIQRAVRETLPNSDDDVRPQLFNLVRRLKAIRSWSGSDADKKAIDLVVDSWCEQASRNGVVVAFDGIKDELETNWGTVRFSHGAKVQDECWAKVNAPGYSFPKCAAYYRNQKVKQLIGLCYELQNANGKDGVWFLSCDDGERLLGVSNPEISRWLVMLRRPRAKQPHKQLLELAEHHVFGENKPNRYRFIGEP